MTHEFENYKIKLQSRYNALLTDLKKYRETIDYYETTGKNLSKELTKTASKAFKSGEIDFLEYVQLLESAKNIEINYLQNLMKYNNTVLEINYLSFQ